MDDEQDALRLEQLRKDVVAGVPGSDKQLFMVLNEDLQRFFRSPDAEELIQATLFRVWTALHAFEPSEAASFRNWVRVIASRVAVDSRRRKEKAKVHWAPEPLDVHDSEPSPSRWMLRRQQWRMIESALTKLSSRFARAIRFRLTGLEARSFADEEGIPLGTAHWRLAEAVRRLRGLVRIRVNTPS